VTGLRDLGPGPGGGIGPPAIPLLWRARFATFGAIIRWRLIVRGILMMGAMLGHTSPTNPARKRIVPRSHLTIGAAAVLVGPLNPVGVFLTTMSAMASLSGRDAGLILPGFAPGRGENARAFIIGRNCPLLAKGRVICRGLP
jgi:hypothetical protein